MIIENARIYYARLNPERPNKKYDVENPTWELQLQTKDPQQVKAWEAAGLKAKPVVDPDNPTNIHWYLWLRRNALRTDPKTKERVPNKPVDVCDGNLEPISPDVIGNGSLANIDIYQVERQDKTGMRSILSAVQIVELIPYERKITQGFKRVETTPSGETTPSVPRIDNNDTPY